MDFHFEAQQLRPKKESLFRLSLIVPTYERCTIPLALVILALSSWLVRYPKLFCTSEDLVFYILPQATTELQNSFLFVLTATTVSTADKLFLQRRAARINNEQVKQHTFA